MPEQSIWLGGIAASMAACFTHPLDLTKVRMQTLEASTTATKPSTLVILRAALAESGIRSLYTGLSASLMRHMTYSLVRLGIYDKMKLRIAERTKRRPTAIQLILAAGISGGLGGLVGNPADILLVRMTSDSTKPLGQRYAYRNAFSGFIRLVKEEGVRALARGLGINTTRAVLMNISQVGSYDYFKTLLLHRSVPFINYQIRDTFVLHVIASTLAGTVATTICSPADVVKSRLMSLPGDSHPLQIFRQSLRDEGVKFLFKGWTPAFIRLAPNTILLFVFFEQLKKLQANTATSF